jgi:hypothetical protein
MGHPQAATRVKALTDMKTNFRMIIVPALQTCGLAAAISLTTLGTALAQPVPTTFTRISIGSIATNLGSSASCAWGDYNNDGFEDLFVANDIGQNDYLYLNNGNGTFRSVLAGDIVNDGTDSSAGVWGDYDNDGYLDLMVTVSTFPTARSNMLYHNEGNGTFSKVTSGSIATDINLGMLGCAWGDYDNDGYVDMFVANSGFTSDAQRKDFLYRNNGAGNFARILSGPMVNDSGRSIAATWGDYNNDGKLTYFSQTSLVRRISSIGMMATECLPKSPAEPLSMRLGLSWGAPGGIMTTTGSSILFVPAGGTSEAARNRLYRNTGLATLLPKSVRARLPRIPRSSSAAPGVITTMMDSSTFSSANISPATTFFTTTMATAPSAGLQLAASSAMAVILPLAPLQIMTTMDSSTSLSRM